MKYLPGFMVLPLVVAGLVLPRPARALCLWAKGTSTSNKLAASPPISAAGPSQPAKPNLRIDNLPPVVWPTQPPNLWVKTAPGRRNVWVRLIDGNGKTRQSFRIGGPARTCLAYDDMYATYRVLPGRPSGTSCVCR